MSRLQNPVESKACTKCKLSKPIVDFPKNARYKTGYDARCKECCNAANKRWRDSNPEKFKTIKQKSYHQNREENLRRSKEYYQKNRKNKKAYDKTYRTENRTQIADYKKNWSRTMRNDPTLKLKQNVRRRLNHVLDGHTKFASTFDLVGCSAGQLKLHLETQFQPEMDWGNYGQFGWHVDHIRPCRLFDLSDLAQQKECFHYSNLRPLWWQDNLGRLRSDTGSNLVQNNVALF